MRIVFAGTPEFAVPTLNALIENGLKPIAVLTSEDIPARRGKGFLPTPVKSVALAHQIPVLQPENLKADDFYEAFRALKPDLLIVVAFKILPPKIFELPTFGAFNLHASLLPKYRGAAPINHALMNGETETGVTTFFLQRKVDTGNIILQDKIQIGLDETAGMLHDRLMMLGADVVLKTVRLIQENKVELQVQDNALATAAPKIFKETCRIDWEKSAFAVHDFIRGLSPFPAAWSGFQGVQFKIIRAKLASEIHLKSGEILTTAKQMWTGCGDGSVEILEVQQEGRKRLETSDFLKGYKFQSDAKWD